MTKRARDLLKYCELSINELNKTNFKNKKWPLRWITAITLLRSVLHVCHKIDCKNIQSLNTYKEYWSVVQKEEIFKNFIDLERNLTIKEFNIQKLTKKNSKNIITEDGCKLLTESGNYLVTEDPIMIGDISLCNRLNSAIKWIKNYLNKIDEIIANYMNDAH